MRGLRGGHHRPRLRLSSCVREGAPRREAPGGARLLNTENLNLQKENNKSAADVPVPRSLTQRVDTEVSKLCFIGPLRGVRLVFDVDFDSSSHIF